MAEGMIFNIQSFSIYDGPGIRTVVFFKGCNMRCIWCHNPESVSFKPELLYISERCRFCGKCKNICSNGVHNFFAERHEINRENCKSCGACSDICYNNSIVLTGQKIEDEQVLKLILKDKPYFENSNGGVTFSGGECMLQQEFLKSLLEKCRLSGIHTAVDTAGNVPFEYFENILPFTDLFLYDIKAADREVHKKLTGVDNGLILKNLEKLLEKNANVTVRIPYIPKANNYESEKIAKLLKKIGVGSAELLPYHKLGMGKNIQYGYENIDFGFYVPDNNETDEVKKIYEKYGVKI